jgi:UDP-N-acetylmuramate dehydrogenase
MALQVWSQHDITPLTTFGVPVTAEYAVPLARTEDIQELTGRSDLPSQPWVILGGGSNWLFTRGLPGLTVLIRITGIEHLEENNEYVRLRVGAGEPWDPFVAYCVERGWGGLENLSLIYGHVGATPVQNIGAYGVEIANVIEYVETVDLHSGETVIFSNAECQFAYRSSVFKTRCRDRYLITHVQYRLSKTFEVTTTYHSLSNALAEKGISDPSILDVRRTVIELRQRKLPNPSEVGNAGSFFENPHVSRMYYAELQKNIPDLPGFHVGEDRIKIPAAWLIEYCGWKGYREGDAGVYPHQPLVMVNYGHASGQAIFELSERVRRSVYETFGIWLEREVTVY